MSGDLRAQRNTGHGVWIAVFIAVVMGGSAGSGFAIEPEAKADDKFGELFWAGRQALALRSNRKPKPTTNSANCLFTRVTAITSRKALRAGLNVRVRKRFSMPNAARCTAMNTRRETPRSIVTSGRIRILVSAAVSVCVSSFEHSVRSPRGIRHRQGRASENQQKRTTIDKKQVKTRNC